MPDPANPQADPEDARSPAMPGTDEDVASNSADLGLCLSGGGYRAMLFHLGSLWRLNEAGLLPKLDRISSVSGGSITAGVLGHGWSRLQFVAGVATNFVPVVVEPIRKLARETLDVGSVVGAGLLGGGVGDRVARGYRKHLFGSATLQVLPDRPRFVFNATNVQSGSLWRFSKPYMADYQVGMVKNPEVELAIAVAASSAFPPVLSPLVMKVDPSRYEPALPGQTLHRERFTSTVVLTDGGVYDNLGLETVWKRCKAVLVSDGGGRLEAEEDPKRNWASHSVRISGIIDHQVRSLRKRQLIGSYRDKHNPKQGAYWSIRSDIANYKLPPKQALPAPHHRILDLANVKTRLKALDEELQAKLINWGYVICDAALRKHYIKDLPVPDGMPYLDSLL